MVDFRLIANGSHLYRRSGHLLRTPIRKTITLVPDERAWYAVAGSYSDGWPTSGFLGGEHYSNVVEVGKRMRRAFLNPTGQQMWRSVTSAHDPEFVFYQGAATPSIARPGCEAYLQLCGYHFTIPDQYADFEVAGMSMSMTHGGTILARYVHSINTSSAYFVKDWPASYMGLYDFRWNGGWTQHFALFDSLNDPTVMLRASTDAINLDTDANSGQPTGGRDLWGNYSSTHDGYIPIATQPYVRTYGVSDTMCLAMNKKRGGWIVGIPDVSVSTAGDYEDTPNDYPSFSNSSLSQCAGYWLCCSYWGLSLTVTLEI